jgi:enoyl-CoA hydratase/carnithine racemase
LSVGQVVAVEAIGLLRKMPAEAVMRMALVGRWERMPATRALELGMISQIVDPPGRLREEAQALAEKIARNSPAAMRATKKALWDAFELGLTDACRANGLPSIRYGDNRLRHLCNDGFHCLICRRWQEAPMAQPAPPSRACG